MQFGLDFTTKLPPAAQERIHDGMAAADEHADHFWKRMIDAGLILTCGGLSADGEVAANVESGVTQLVILSRGRKRMGKGSLARRQRKALENLAKVWTTWEDREITDELRDEHPHLEHCSKIYTNSRYELHLFNCGSSLGGVVQVNIARHHSNVEIPWADVQAIKNQIFGESAVAVELYPEEKYRWGTSTNLKVIWVMPKDFTLPFGLHLAAAFGRST